MGVKVGARDLFVLVAAVGFAMPAGRAFAAEGETAEAAVVADSPQPTAEQSEGRVTAPEVTPLDGEGAPTASPELIAKRKRGKVKFGVFAGYGIGNQLKFGKVRYPVSTAVDQTSELGYETSGAPVVGAELMVPGFNNWGAILGFAADLNRELKSFTFSSPTGTEPTSLIAPEGAKLSTYSIYVNIFYRWSKFYIPFGFSYSFASVSSPNKALEGLQGDFGGQAGAGIFVTEWLALEWLLRYQSVTGVEHANLPGGESIDLKAGSIWNNTFLVKAYF